jgi:hypothetical protein
MEALWLATLAGVPEAVAVERTFIVTLLRSGIAGEAA